MKKFLLLIFLSCSLSIFSQELDSNLPPLEQLVEKYAPMIRHNIQEAHLPSSVEWFLNNSVLAKKRAVFYFAFFDEWAYSDEYDIICDLKQDGCREKMAQEARFTGNSLEDQKWFIGMNSNSIRQGNLSSTKAYVNIRLAHYQQYPRFEYDIEIQYWFFWPFNGATDPLGNWSDHEGDWEGVSVILNSKGELKYIASTAHGDRNFYNPDQIEKDGTHPVLYAAKNSHALYNKNGHFNTFLGFDDTWGVKGIKEFKAWQSYEIIQIDSRIQNSGITPTTPKWMQYGGRWGSTFSQDIIDFNFGFGSVEITTSNSPRFVKYQELSEWLGQYDGKNPFPHNYTLPGEEPNQISGSSQLCINNDYTYRININKSKRVKWTAPDYNFSPASSSATTFTTKADRTGSNKKINAAVTVVHKINNEVAFETKHNFSKNVTIGNATTSSFSLSTNTTSIGSSCLTQVNLYNSSGISPSSVKWTTTGNLTLGYKTNSYANITSSNGASGTVTAEITICNKKIIKSTRIITMCDTDEGGGGIGIKPIDGDGGFGGGGVGFQDIQSQVYPNPTTGTIRLTLTNSSEVLKNVRVVVFDQSGKKIKEVEVSELRSHIDLDISNEKHGVYIINAFSDDEIFYKGKVIKNQE